MKKKYCLLLLIPALLTSCGPKAKLEFVNYTPIEEDVSMKQAIVEEGKYHRNDSYNPIELEYGVRKGLTETSAKSFSNLKEISTSRDGKFILNSTGDVKLLVVPVRFKGQKGEDLEEKRIDLQNAFFGDKAHNSYESVASYYNQSSYGQLRITGEVADWYQCNLTIQDAKSKTAKLGNSGEAVSKIIASEALDYIKSQGKIDLSKYDIDEDGNIDAIYFVYDYPQDDGESGNRCPLFWAYFDSVPRNYKESEVEYNTTAPYVSSYSWSSVNFMGENYLTTNVVESNTYIHETGHLLGLDDYYNTNPKITDVSNPNTAGIFQPTGFMDMMDYNIGDHNCFSKYILDWAYPYVLDGECEITLKSFTKTGDFILIPSPNWNGTPFDEYLLIEYYTPDRLNYAYNFPSYTYIDGKNNVRVFNYPTKHGLRVYHVDARLAYFKTKGIKKTESRVFDDPDLASFMSTYGQKYIDFHQTNDTQGYVDDNKEVLIHLLESSGENSFGRGEAASNKTIFGRKDSFGYDTFIDFEFNKVKSNIALPSFEYKFIVTELDSQKITVKFEKR